MNQPQNMILSKSQQIFCAIILVLYAFSCHAKPADKIINYQTYNPTSTSVVHVLIVDPVQVKIIAVRAQDIGQGLINVGNVAMRFNALAAINGGYFRLDAQQENNGIPAGILKVNNIWHGIAYKPRAAIAWQPETAKTLIDIVQTKSQLLLQDQAVPIHAMNKLLSGNRATLLSDSYTNGIEFTGNTGLLILDRRIQAVYHSGNTTVPEDAYIYNSPAKLLNKIAVKVGDPAIVNIKLQPQLDLTSAKQWNKMPFIVGGGPVLIANGKKQTNFAREDMQSEFINEHTARTAVGIMPDKRWVLVVAERNLLEENSGLSIPELRDFMYSLGCVAALNLDGGGSSTMYVMDRKYTSIMDQPVANALLVLEKD